MRFRTTTALVTVLLSLASRQAWSGHVLFDFEQPGQDQTGSYEASAEVTLQAGTARLAERDDWALPEWRWRVALFVDVPGGTALHEYPVRVDLSVLPDEVFDEARLDGADLVITDESGSLVPVRWVEWFDFIARQGTLWFRPADLAPGRNRFFLYFGNPDHEDPGSPEAVFTYSGPITSAVVASSQAASATLVLTSFLDGNTVHLEPAGLDVNLDAQETGSVGPQDLSPQTLLSAPKPFFGMFDADGTDALVPLVASSTDFVYLAPRYTDVLAIYAPFADAQVTVLDGQNQVATLSVPAGQVTESQADVADGHGMVVHSDQPVAVIRWDLTSNSAYDAMVFLPPDQELVGASSGNSWLAALEDDTVVDVYDSDGLHESFVLHAGQTRAISSHGSQGSGPAIHVLASGPVAGLSYADGDGGEAVTFLRRQDLGRTYLVPRQAQYVLVASPSPGVTCRIRDASGRILAEKRSDVLAPDYPNRLSFTNVPGGSALVCDAPVFAMMEDAATDDERNLWPMKFHRPALPEPVTVTVASSIESHYRSTEGWVTTPVVQPSEGVSRFLNFLERADVPTGTSIRYQLSVDGATSWVYYDGQSWTQAVTTHQANAASTVRRHIRELQVPEGSLAVRAYLLSEDGTQTPVLDDLELDYAGPGEAVTFAFDTVDGTQVAGRPFQVTVTALDASGLVATAFDESAEIATLHGQTIPARTPRFTAGRVTFQVAVLETGPSVRLTATHGAVFGISDPFPVTAPDPSSLRVEYVSGDQQVGQVGEPLADPLVVRVWDQETDRPAPGVMVTFRVVEGGGTLRGPAGSAASEVEVRTDATGLASVEWILGPEPGPNVAEGILEGAEGSPIPFEARGDPPGTTPNLQEYWASGGGGCDCRTSRGQHAWWLGGLALVWAVRRRRRRRGLASPPR